jgi:hypothetical protein
MRGYQKGMKRQTCLGCSDRDRLEGIEPSGQAVIKIVSQAQLIHLASTRRNEIHCRMLPKLS